MKGKTKSQKGITLVALIITVVILLILAVVAVTAIQNDGILEHANNAANQYTQKQEEENGLLNGYEGLLNNYINNTGSGNGQIGTTIKTVAEVKNVKQTSNTKVVDEYGNKVVIPAGFMVRVDASTNNAEHVTEGIVIEDCTGTATNGSQFVWIPVGKVYADTAKTESLAKTITLGRYEFDSTTGEASTFSDSAFIEDTVDSHDSTIHDNGIARDIEAFMASTNPTTGNGGYYIGRYEARTNDTTGRNSEADDLTSITVIKENAVYNYIEQVQAVKISQAMYADGYSSGTFSSDLVNSYAWDTAIVFLQTFDNRTDRLLPYSMQTGFEYGDFSNTGTTSDVVCNVYDMASNCIEWTTETCVDDPTGMSDFCRVFRGDSATSSRTTTGASSYWGELSFRPVIYLAI